MQSLFPSPALTQRFTNGTFSAHQRRGGGWCNSGPGLPFSSFCGLWPAGCSRRQLGSPGLDLVPALPALFSLPAAFYSSVHFAHAEGSREGWRWPTLPSSPAKETGYHSFRQPELVRRPGAACLCASLGRATCRSQQPFPLLTPPHL